jgi:hypothetical protein
MIFQAGDGGQKFYSYKQNFNTGKNKITEIILSGKNQTEQKHLKIRPHIANISLDGDKEKNVSCEIKVFQYANQKDAKLDKYMSWNIYKRK